MRPETRVITCLAVMFGALIICLLEPPLPWMLVALVGSGVALVVLIIVALELRKENWL